METQLYQGTNSNQLNKLKKTRLVGLLSLISIAFIVTAIIVICVGQSKTAYTYNDFSITSLYNSTVSSGGEYYQYLAAFGALMGIGLIYELVVAILYVVMVSRLNVDKFKLWTILLIVGLCVMPILYFIAWIYTLVEIKNMINKQK
ncbi:hypothetical protein OF376_00010 [Ureaplasma miroungigenitalium]|uniref:DUF4064 domain-containing protein n=1 Tax=Ureaplasma miroungigenitalium TaxID=1042321 RepID=A0ABT3BLM6_9BACT|nr:hypothetical protein [Ureaplasma miroungigenitalium]MCV3728174.1 hypothetical protein [Ureaplasma miroungigenitalium]MCV3733978.1 hypothetical protein [Ureaplasma miroungigenitalium]